MLAWAMQRLNDILSDKRLYYQKEESFLPIGNEALFYGCYNRDKHLWSELCFDKESPFFEDFDDHLIKGLVGGICSLYRGKEIKRWKHFEQREVESFLRSQNHEALHDELNLDENYVKNLVSELNLSFRSELFYCALKTECEIRNEVWDKEPLANAKALKKLEESFLREFMQREQIELELFSLEGDDLFVAMESPKQWLLSGLGAFLREKFSFQGLNIVAEPLSSS